MSRLPLQEKFDLAPGEIKTFTGTLDGNIDSIRMKLRARCPCGGQLIPHKQKESYWICNKSHWWNRRKHACLKLNIELITEKS